MLDGMHLSDVVFRFLSLCDIEEVKALCKLWFPLDYPNTWYNDVLSNPQFFSLAACHSNNIIGLIVAEIKEASRVNEEDSSLLDYGLIYNADVAYILALGVMEEYRRCGIASLLLDTFLRHLTAQEMKKVKVVYLHVLATNDKALRFYEKRNFRSIADNFSCHLFSGVPELFPSGGMVFIAVCLACKLVLQLQAKVFLHFLD
ncbi:hypothetical protein QYM36_008871 [Artemia franciscana]|uniref:N-alpha-acetyltransferase 60 n=1 Tax=Artemia franciscana TaxID=6661 RepID=A0AA88L0K8_ARTSF|nr:hypothetical protein QYM36_008871 [Artemia franciscana]